MADNVTLPGSGLCRALRLAGALSVLVMLSSCSIEVNGPSRRVSSPAVMDGGAASTPLPSARRVGYRVLAQGERASVGEAAPFVVVARSVAQGAQHERIRQIPGVANSLTGYAGEPSAVLAVFGPWRGSSGYVLETREVWASSPAQELRVLVRLTPPRVGGNAAMHYTYQVLLVPPGDLPSSLSTVSLVDAQDSRVLYRGTP